MAYYCSGVTNVGLVRKNNEDAICCDGKKGLIAVADGIGGQAGGEVASSIAIRALREVVAKQDGSDGPLDLLKTAFFYANHLVYTGGHGGSGPVGMGTTMTAMLLDGDDVYLLHVGDCRAYLLRAGLLQRLTDDHSLAEELYRDGSITEQQAANHPQRHILTRSLGQDSHVEADEKSFKWQKGDLLLIASDGFYNMLDDTDITDAFAYATPDNALDILVAKCLERGGYDNISAVVAGYGQVSEL